MTKKEVIQKAHDTNELMLKKGGYIKGMGTGKFRLMTQDHSPIENIDGRVVETMQDNGLLMLSNLVWVSSGVRKSVESIKDAANRARVS